MKKGRKNEIRRKLPFVFVVHCHEEEIANDEVGKNKIITVKFDNNFMKRKKKKTYLVRKMLRQG